MKTPIALENLNHDELARILISHTPIGYVLLDETLRIRYVNDYYLKLRGLTKDKAVGQFCYTLANDGEVCPLCVVRSAMESGKPERMYRKDILPNGTWCFIDDLAIPLGDIAEDGHQYYLEIIADRTDEMVARNQYRQGFFHLLHNLVYMLEAKDEYTAEHSRSVNLIALGIAREMGLSGEDLQNVDVAAILHDIGKVLIDYHIINKPGALTQEEYKIIQYHPVASYEIIEDLSAFARVKRAVLHHHERFDGKGYPDGLSGEEIPLEARIISVADTYDAMTSSRSYRTAMSHEEAVEEIRRNAGTQFDPAVVDAFLTLNDVHGYNKRPGTGEYPVRTLVEAKDVNTGQAEQMELKQLIGEKKLNQVIFEHTPVAYAILDRDYRVLFASPHYDVLYHTTGSEITGMRCYEAIGMPDICPECPMPEAFFAGQNKFRPVQREVDGETRYFDCYAIPYNVHNGRVENTIVMHYDRTEERRMTMHIDQDFRTLSSILPQLLARNDHHSFHKSIYIECITKAMCKAMELPWQLCNDIQLAADLCDIGMISIGDVYAENPQLAKVHPRIACSILDKLPRFKKASEIIKYHHERYNGGGYPYGLCGKAIPLGSRMIYMANCYYENLGKGHAYAYQYICHNADGRFDPELVELFAQLFRDGVEIAENNDEALLLGAE